MSAAQSRVVADRYRLVETLGQGGMGRVWMARDELLHRDVAIKELIPPPGLTDDERQEMRERAMREARAIARLSHPNVVRIFDILRNEGEPWIVMEYVRSRSLQEVLAQDGPLPARRVAEIGLGMLAALKAAHRNGVVHRDIKPGNVLLGDDGRVVLTDFGLATVPGDPVVTRTGLVLGSPAYISPERAHDGTAGPAADMWSLGATLYAAVEGQSPYARPSAIATLAALATEPPAPPRRAGALKPVLNGLLRKNPADRIQADEAERLLMRAAGRRSRSGVPLLPGTRRPFAEGYLPTPHSGRSPSSVAASGPAAESAGVDKPSATSPKSATPALPVASESPADSAASAKTTAPGDADTPSRLADTAAPGMATDSVDSVAGATADSAAAGDSLTSSRPASSTGAAETATGAEAVSPKLLEEQAAGRTPGAEPAVPDQAGEKPDSIAASTEAEKQAPPVIAPLPRTAGSPKPAANLRVAAKPKIAQPAKATSATTYAARAAAGPGSLTATRIGPAVTDTPDGLLTRVRRMPPQALGGLAAVVAVLLVALLFVVLPDDDSATKPGAGASNAAPPGSPAAPASNAPSPSPSASEGLVLPPGWHIHRDKSGWSVAVPKNWTVDRSDPPRVYFREQTGERRVLCIDRSDTPKWNPVKDWEEQESARSSNKTNYERVGIRKVKYFLAAADWEYKYDLAARLHAINRGFVTGPHQAHAILWITPERTWNANRDEFELITKSFVPIPE